MENTKGNKLTENGLRNKVTFLVNSCDKYEDVWYPFFKLFDKFGGELKNCDIVLNTESKTFHYEGLNIVCPQLYAAGENVEWGKRFKDTLNTIKTEYVFEVLEDFFLRRQIDTDVIERCVGYLDENKNIGAFNFESLDGAIVESERYKDFCIIPSDAIYRFNAQACLWRKDVLFNSLLDIESPWDWETYGNLRNRVLFKDTEIYALKLDAREPYFYDFYKFGEYAGNRLVLTSSITRGKWVIESVENLFKENDIIVDYSIRGEYVVPKHTIFKETWLYRFLFRVSYPFRKAALDQIVKDQMDKFVNPYIDKK